MASTETTTLEQAKAGRAEGLWAPALTALGGELAPDAERTVAHVRQLLDEKGFRPPSARRCSRRYWRPASRPRV